MRLGATSLFLNMLQAQTEPQARIFIKESNFTLKNDVPILMVGPGTGVVPFIAFIEEREFLVEQGK
jgi:NADPH-ferrihemoprotein reductase